ncbi:MAG: hypothetical protein ABJD68_20465, partial [Nakamurella sp.]
HIGHAAGDQLVDQNSSQRRRRIHTIHPYLPPARPSPAVGGQLVLLHVELVINLDGGALHVCQHTELS